jgi:phenol 2-monooxygenase (NADPH)
LIERRDGPLQDGQADGIACPTVEMFEAFGLGHQRVREAYWVNETVFWRPAKGDRTAIERTGRVQGTEDGLSEFPHVIVNQARLQQYLLGYMRKSPARLEANDGLDFVSLKVEAAGDYLVVVPLRDSIDAVPSGDFANQAWGVVDMLAVTDFPDVRLKAAIQSADEGNNLLNPREGGYMVRL